MCIRDRFHTLLTYGDTPWGLMATLGSSYSMRGYYEGYKCSADAVLGKRMCKQVVAAAVDCFLCYDMFTCVSESLNSVSYSCLLYTSVADVKSLVIHPATTTHSQLTDEERADQVIGRNTIRLSIGTEHIDDIISDLSQAFYKV